MVHQLKNADTVMSKDDFGENGDEAEINVNFFDSTGGRENGIPLIAGAVLLDGNWLAGRLVPLAATA